jgi:hypothetical protein
MAIVDYTPRGGNQIPANTLVAPASGEDGSTGSVASTDARYVSMPGWIKAISLDETTLFNANGQLLPFLPRGSLLSLFGHIDYTSARDPSIVDFDTCWEIAIRPEQHLTTSEVFSQTMKDHCAVAWLWGDGYAAANPFNVTAETLDRWILSCCGHSANWGIWVRPGRTGLGAPNGVSTLNLRAFVSVLGDQAPGSCTINQECTVPPFEPTLTTGWGLGAFFPVPTKQAALSPRKWRSKLINMVGNGAGVGTVSGVAKAVQSRIGGGPWRPHFAAQCATGGPLAFHLSAADEAWPTAARLPVASNSGQSAMLSATPGYTVDMWACEADNNAFGTLPGSVAVTGSYEISMDWGGQ